jgi:hypothetical protein
MNIVPAGSSACGPGFLFFRKKACQTGLLSGTF